MPLMLFVAGCLISCIIMGTHFRNNAVKKKEVINSLLCPELLNDRSSVTGKTPFYNILLTGDEGHFRAAIKAGGDPNIPSFGFKDGEWLPDKDGNSALQVALKTGNYSQALLIIRIVDNLDLKFQNHYGVNALEITRRMMMRHNKGGPQHQVLASIESILEGK